MSDEHEPAVGAADPTKKKREPKPRPEPQYKVGDVVTTRGTVQVKHPDPGYRGRRILHLLRGCEWKVQEVLVPPKPSRASAEYRLKSSTFECKRKEWQLRLIRR